MVKDKNTVRCISVKANFKPARNILNLEAILYCILVYLVPGIKSRALWWQNVYTFKKQAQCDSSTEWQSCFYRYSNSFFICVYGHDTACKVNYHNNQTSSPIAVQSKKLTPKGRLHQIHCFQVMFR